MSITLSKKNCLRSTLTNNTGVLLEDRSTDGMGEIRTIYEKKNSLADRRFHSIKSSILSDLNSQMSVHFRSVQIELTEYRNSFKLTFAAFLLAISANFFIYRRAFGLMYYIFRVKSYISNLLLYYAIACWLLLVKFSLTTM